MRVGISRNIGSGDGDVIDVVATCVCRGLEVRGSYERECPGAGIDRELCPVGSAQAVSDRHGVGRRRSVGRARGVLVEGACRCAREGGSNGIHREVVGGGGRVADPIGGDHGQGLAPLTEGLDRGGGKGGAPGGAIHGRGFAVDGHRGARLCGAGDGDPGRSLGGVDDVVGGDDVKRRDGRRGSIHREVMSGGGAVAGLIRGNHGQGLRPFAKTADRGGGKGGTPGGAIHGRGLAVDGHRGTRLGSAGDRHPGRSLGGIDDVVRGGGINARLIGGSGIQVYGEAVGGGRLIADRIGDGGGECIIAIACQSGQGQVGVAVGNIRRRQYGRPQGGDTLQHGHRIPRHGRRSVIG